jgi:hypothetical protein
MLSQKPPPILDSILDPSKMRLSTALTTTSKVKVLLILDSPASTGASCIKPPATEDKMKQINNQKSPLLSPISHLLSPAPIPAPSPSSLLPSPPFSLRRDLGFWQLTFEGQFAIIKHERGILFVAYLLLNPPEHPIHAIDLIAKIPGLYRQHLGLTELVDPATGLPVQIEADARLQERSLALDDAELARALLKEEKKLYALLDDPEEIEPVKAEALRRLEELAEFQKQHSRRSVDTAQRLVRTIRQSISRLYLHLAAATDRQGNPHPVLRPFADHVNKYLLIPSARFASSGSRHARTGLAGCFTYEPPSGVVWDR